MSKRNQLYRSQDLTKMGRLGHQRLPRIAGQQGLAVEPVCETAQQRWMRGVCASEEREGYECEGRDRTVNFGSMTGKGQ